MHSAAYLHDLQGAVVGKYHKRSRGHVCKAQLTDGEANAFGGDARRMGDQWHDEQDASKYLRRDAEEKEHMRYSRCHEGRGEASYSTWTACRHAQTTSAPT